MRAQWSLCWMLKVYLLCQCRWSFIICIFCSIHNACPNRWRCEDGNGKRNKITKSLRKGKIHPSSGTQVRKCVFLKLVFGIYMLILGKFNSIHIIIIIHPTAYYFLSPSSPSSSSYTRREALWAKVQSPVLILE